MSLRRTTDSLAAQEELHKIRNRWRAITLSEYIRNKMILRGLRIQEAPSGMDRESFIRAWMSVFHRCSSVLVDNAIQCVNKYECISKESWKGTGL